MLLSKGTISSNSLRRAKLDKIFEDEKVFRIQRVRGTNSVTHLSASLELSGWSAYLEHFPNKDST